MMAQVYQPSSLDYTKIVSVVYAIVLSSLGIIFPIAEALKDQWLKTVYNTVFLTFNLTLSSVFLVYLLFYILRNENKSKRKQTKPETKSQENGFQLANIFQRRKPPKQVIDKNENIDQYINREEKDYISQSFENLSDKTKTLPHSLSRNSFGGIDLGYLGGKSHSSVDSCPEKSIYYSREVIPIDEFHKIPPRNFRNITCPTIREVSSRTNSNSDGEYEQPTDNLVEGHSDPLTWIDAESFGSVFTHHGSSMFLRLGALIFGLGNLVNYALEIQANLFSNVECLNQLRFGWIYIWKFIFVTLQTFFLFKHAMIHVKKHRPLVWFGMVHLIFTNINLWIHTLVREIKDEYHYKILSATYGSNISKLYKALDELCDSDLLHAVAKYLMPFVLEYSLIAVGSISCFLYFGGIESGSISKKENRHLIRVFSLAPSDFQKFNNTDPLVTTPHVHLAKETQEPKVRFSSSLHSEAVKTQAKSRRKSEISFMNHQQQSGSNFNPLQKSHVGMFAGIVVLGGAAVTCVVFLFSQIQDNQFRAEIIFHSTDITIHSLLLIACIMVFVLTKNLAFVPKPTTTDDFLLLLAAFGSLTYEAVNASALFSTMFSPADNFVRVKSVNNSNINNTMYNRTLHNNSTIFVNSTDKYESEYAYLIRDRLQLASSMIGMIQTAVQTLLILVSLRRYPVSLKDAKEMPGRGTLAFLILGNLSVWILRTVLTKNLQLPVQSTFYGMVAWHLLMNINLPLLLFFRFHSSVCFADIWKVAYQLLTRPEKTN